MSKIFIIFILAINILFLGCAEQKRVVVAKKELPSWYINPPQSTSKVLYGVGEGRDKRSSTLDALNNIASTLSISITSSYKAKTVVKEGRENSVDATYVNNIKSRVKRVTISSYQVIKMHKLGFNKYAVLVKIDKKELFENLQDEVDVKINMLDAKEHSIQNSDALRQLQFYKSAIKGFEDIKNTLIIMELLDHNFDPKGYMQRYERYTTKQRYYLERIRFYIKSNLDVFKAPIASGLSRSGYHISKTIQKSKNSFVVNIYAKIKKANAYGFTLARSQISLNVKDYRGVLLFSNSFHLDGKSSQGYEIAKADLAKQLDKKIKKEQIEQVLGLFNKH